MRNGTKRTHSYYAEAHALGKIHGSDRLHSKEQIFLDPNAGGARRCQFGKLEFPDDGIFAESACLEVIGEPMEDGGWKTSAFSEVNGLNVRDRVKASRISGRVTTEHPAEGYVPSLTFTEVAFEGLTLNDCPIQPLYMLDIVGPTPAELQFKDPEANPYLIEYIKSDPFLRAVKAQDTAIANNEKAPGWARARFGSHQQENKVKCSLVSRTSGLSDDIAFGHVIDVPDFGKLFLAELVVGEHFDLTMMRIEFYDGMFSIGGPGVNGKTRP